MFYDQLPVHSLIIALTLLSYLWFSQLVGRLWAILPAALFLFSALAPNLQSELLLTAGFFLALFGFLNFTAVRPSSFNLLLAGLGVGGAFLTGGESNILILLLPFLMLIFYLAGLSLDWSGTSPKARLRRFSIRGFRYLRAVFFMIIIGGLFFLTVSSLRDKEFSPQPLLTYFQELKFKPAIPDFSQISLIRTLSLPALILIGWGILLTLSRFPRWGGFLHYLATHFQEFSFLIFIGALGLYHPQLSLPFLPYIYLLTAGSFKKWLAVDSSRLGIAVFHYNLALSLKTLILIILLGWQLLDAILIISQF